MVSTHGALQAWFMELDDAKQLTQLFSTENNLLIRALSRELLVLLLSYSHSPFYIIDKIIDYIK